MKKLLFPLMIASIFIFAVSAHAEPLDTLTTEDGNVSIIGFTTAEDNDGNPCFVALLQYENTTNESAAPFLLFNEKAYQDGIELESAYIYNFSYENFKSSDTNVRPGGTLNYYELFKIDSGSPVDLEVAPMFDFDHVHIEYTFDLAEEIIPASLSLDDGSNETGTSTVAQKIAELELKVAELEKRVSELENRE